MREGLDRLLQLLLIMLRKTVTWTCEYINVIFMQSFSILATSFIMNFKMCILDSQILNYFDEFQMYFANTVILPCS